jgi:bifunctional DNA-binding transcriptional regulator/antitoxin component of YhaV-PrlF toxin-antitoxin module
MAPKLKPVITTKVGEKGQITILNEYRRAYKIEKNTQLLLIQVGDALMIVPQDAVLERISKNIQDALHRKGVTSQGAKAKLEKVRKKLFKELYGDID